jgi:hypothetical protein
MYVEANTAFQHAQERRACSYFDVIQMRTKGTASTAGRQEEQAGART